MPDPLPPQPRSSLFRLSLFGLVLLGIFALSVDSLVEGSPRALLGVALGYMIYELAVAAILTGAAVLGIRQSSALTGGSADGVTVLIAAHNERDFILETIESIWKCAGSGVPIVVASDGSTDGMNERLTSALGLDASERPEVFKGRGITLLTLPKMGKAAALNRALDHVRSPVVVTLDADTTLGSSALARIAAPFADPEVDAAAGFIYPRNAQQNLLTRYQFTEYLKNFVWRIGLARMGVCLQVSGAFGALRTSALRELGGFDENTLVEDYEVIYRLYRHRAGQGRRARVVAVPEASAFTEVPSAWGPFINQRTRWFTGFMQTLWSYRFMIGSRQYGAVGLFMLPLKSVDATLPAWGLTSLIYLVAASFWGPTPWVWWAGALFGLKWLIDAGLYAGMVIWHGRAYASRRPQPAWWTQLATSATESLVFNWLRQVAVVRSYVWFFRRTARWEQARWQSAMVSTGAAGLAVHRSEGELALPADRRAPLAAIEGLPDQV